MFLHSGTCVDCYQIHSPNPGADLSGPFACARTVEDGSNLFTNHYWHVDSTFVAGPVYSCLKLERVPENGGEPLWMLQGSTWTPHCTLVLIVTVHRIHSTRCIRITYTK